MIHTCTFKWLEITNKNHQLHFWEQYFPAIFHLESNYKLTLAGISSSSQAKLVKSASHHTSNFNKSYTQCIYKIY